MTLALRGGSSLLIVELMGAFKELMDESVGEFMSELMSRWQ